ncbi:MAG: prephenate dehydratase [Alphaproteobacteria bacterium]
MPQTAGEAAKRKRIAYQGEPGAYSHLACNRFFPELEAVPCDTFEDAFSAIAEGRVDLGMIPIENSLAGRVADIHHLLPESGLYVIGERFRPVHHQLLGLRGAKLENLKTVMSHTQALGQCRMHLRKLGLKPVVAADTAGAARLIAQMKDPSVGALASELAAEIYGLDILKPDMEDAAHNTTRFVVLSREPDDAEPGNGPVITTLVFRVRNVPAALYKALGGFATNGVNMTKLESYQLEGSFSATQFYADIEGHPQDRLVRLAIEELEFFSTQVKVLGVYPADPFRAQTKPSA